MQVRTIDLCGASADEVSNFELSCLGEVRMLSVLKHSCIVELYGHQISSKWSATADGNCGGRTLQSAILMEDIKGGSLRVSLSLLILVCLILIDSHSFVSNLKLFEIYRAM